MPDRKAAFIHCPELEKYSYPPDCPFNTVRAGKVRETLESIGALTGKNKKLISPEPANRIVLKKFHTARYLHALQNAEKGKWDLETLRMGIGTPDCPIFKGMYAYAALACGATLTAANLILSGDYDVAFNPSGGYHHAGPEMASGFCYINDVALACRVLNDAGKKVLYLDVDVHFGDGVAYAFYDRSDVLTISFHESGQTLFPGTGSVDEIGTGPGKGYCVNVPLPIGTYDEIYLKAFREIALPLMASFAPDVIVFELGADGLAGDPLAHLYLTNNVYVEIINHLLNFQKSILATGGGGYNIPNTVRAWSLAWSVLAGDTRNAYMDVGLGGVMLQTTDWQGGLKDREIAVGNQQRKTVKPRLQATIENVKNNIFPYHKI